MPLAAEIGELEGECGPLENRARSRARTAGRRWLNAPEMQETARSGLVVKVLGCEVHDGAILDDPARMDGAGDAADERR